MADRYIPMNEVPLTVTRLDGLDEDTLTPEITTEHKTYLLSRHESVGLVPLPSADPTDTLNWSDRKKNTHLALVAFHGIMSTGQIVGIIPAFEEFSHTYNLPIDQASFIGTIPLLFLASGPLVWIPLADRFGRRPIWLISTFCAGAFNIGSALAPSYASHIILRILVAFFISPGIALGQGVIVECFFANQRARKMGIWTFMVNCGAQLGPLVMGFVVTQKGWPWMYWISATINLAQFLLSLAFAPETIYSGERGMSFLTGNDSAFRRQYFSWRRINPAPLQIRDFLEPLFLLKNHKILLATVSYAFSFNFVMVMLVYEMSVLYSTRFHMAAQEIGVNFLSLFIGSLLGAFIGGPLSDYFVRHQKRRSGRDVIAPEARLMVAHVGFPFIIIGVVVFFVQLGAAETWNITPTIGAGVAAFGMETVTPVLITYCSDASPSAKSAPIGATINFARLGWAFFGPFWYTPLLDACGFRGAAGLIAGLIIAVSVLPIVFLQMTSGKR